MVEALADAVRTYPGWMLFCGLIIVTALLKAVVLIARKDLY